MAKISKTRCLLIALSFGTLAAILYMFAFKGITQPPLAIIPENYIQGFAWEKPLRLKPLASTYRNSLFNLTLKYVIEPKKCLEPGILAVIVVTSYYGNVETRSSMRRAFNNRELGEMGLRRVFLLGEAPSDIYTKQESILAESRRFGDVLQGNFIEAYRNLTFKHLMGLKWASESCPKAKYIVKMDDDIVIDTRKVQRLLMSTTFPTNLLAGYILRQMVPIREPANKWYVTSEEFEGATYPPFLSGWFYITTPRISAKFVLLSHYYTYFWIDDVYVTGILARSLKMKHYDLSKNFTVHPEVLQCCMNDVINKKMDCDVMIGPNGGDPELFRTFNDVMAKCGDVRSCEKRNKPSNETCVAERKFNLGRGHSMVQTYKLHK